MISPIYELNNSKIYGYLSSTSRSVHAFKMLIAWKMSPRKQSLKDINKWHKSIYRSIDLCHCCLHSCTTWINLSHVKKCLRIADHESLRINHINLKTCRYIALIISLLASYLISQCRTWRRYLTMYFLKGCCKHIENNFTVLVDITNVTWKNTLKASNA